MSAVQLPNHAEFEPSREAINHFRYTRKPYFPVRGERIPALIGCHDYGTDTTCFFITLVLEIFGLSMIVLNNLPLEIATIVVLVAMAVDVFLAVVHHYFMTNNNCIFEATALEAEYGIGSFANNAHADVRSASMEWNRNNIKKNKAIAKIFTFLIVLFCIAKITIYAALNGFEAGASLIFITLTYIAVAYFHLSKTGYFLAGWWAIRKFKKEVLEYEADRAHEGLSGSVTDARRVTSIQFKSDQGGIPEEGYEIVQGGHVRLTLKPVPASDSGQAVQAAPNRQKTYELKCYGVLMDTEVISLLNLLPKETETTYLLSALHCMHIQLTNYPRGGKAHQASKKFSSVTPKNISTAKEANHEIQ